MITNADGVLLLHTFVGLFITTGLMTSFIMIHSKWRSQIIRIIPSTFIHSYSIFICCTILSRKFAGGCPLTIWERSLRNGEARQSPLANFIHEFFWKYINTGVAEVAVTLAVILIPIIWKLERHSKYRAST